MPGMRPKFAIVMAATTEDNPAIDPTLKSISAEAMTKVMATAIIEMVAVCLTMFSKLLPVAKPELPSVMVNSSRTTTKAI